jgi:hypothetical protein
LGTPGLLKHTFDPNSLTRIFKIVGHGPEVGMPNGEPVRVEAERVSEGAQLAARGQRVEGEHGNVDADNSGKRLIVLQNGINSSKKLKMFF